MVRTINFAFLWSELWSLLSFGQSYKLTIDNLSPVDSLVKGNDKNNFNMVGMKGINKNDFNMVVMKGINKNDFNMMVMKGNNKNDVNMMVICDISERYQ